MPRLLFCLTPGNSLATWQDTKTLQRELKSYLAYAERGWQVKILTFAQERSRDYDLPAGITLTWFPHRRLLPFLPLLRPNLGRWADLIKTNQSVEAWHYVRAGQAWRKPVLLRCGYVAGEKAERLEEDPSAVQRYQRLEKHAFQHAAHCLVPTSDLSEWLQTRYTVAAQRISVIPNFIDTQVFHPTDSSMKMPRSVIAIGRLAPTKRLDLLIRACSHAGVQKLTIIGDGPESSNLQKLARACNLNLEIPGRIPNQELPGYLYSHAVFAQVSAWEGHPKTLIEAMACGCCCLVTNTVGLESQIEHGVTGWIAPSATEDQLANDLIALLARPDLQHTLGSAAAIAAKTKFSFESVFDQELTIATRLLRSAEPMQVKRKLIA